jgi:hypothetical protein
LRQREGEGWKKKINNLADGGVLREREGGESKCECGGGR